MDDLVQLEHLKMEAQADARPLEDSVSFDATEEKCSIIRNGAHHEDTGDSQTETAGEHADLTMLLHKDERKASLQYFCPGCYSFVRAYRSANPQERVSPFAIVLLLVLFIIYVLNQADRLVLPVVIPAGLRCQSDESNECVSANATPPGNQSANASGADCIHFGDSEQGLLTGPAFTVIYVVAGLPLARFADAKSRSLVLLIGLFFWSVAVLLTGFVKTFWQLLLLRILLGIGEASCNPVAYSLLADFFPPQHRALALSVYHYGVYLGGGLGWMIGAINDVLDWRWTFRILGMAGLVMVPVATLALWEPHDVWMKRKARQKGKASYSIKEVALYLVTLPPFWLLLVAASIRNIPGYALGAWLPTFYVRVHDVVSSDYGIKVGLVVIFGGGLGSFLGGFFSDRLSMRWKNAKAFVIAFSQLLAAPSIAAVLLVPEVNASYGLLFVAYVTAETWLGPAAAIVQDICMPAMRAQASAVYIGVITIVASLGPVIVPGLMEGISIFDQCAHGIQYALLLIAPSFYVVAALLFVVLGIVIQCWAERQRRKTASYSPFTDSGAQKGRDTEDEDADSPN